MIEAETLRTERGAVVAGFALFACLGLVQASFGALLPTFRDQYDLDRTALGLLVSAFFGGSLVSTVVAGATINRETARQAVTLLLGLVVVGAIGLAVLRGWPSKVLSAGTVGLGYGGLALCVNTHFASRSGRGGVILVNSLNGVFGLGAIVAPALVGARLSAEFRYEYLVLAAAVLLCLPVARLGVDQRPLMVGESRGRPVEAIRDAAPFAVGLFWYAGLEIGCATWAATHLLDLGYSAGAAAALSGLFWAGIALGRFVIPIRFGHLPPVGIVAGCLAAALLALTLTAVPAIAPVGYLLAGVAAGPVVPTMLVCASRASSQPRRANATAITAALFGAAVLPTAVGRAVDLTSPRVLPVLIACCVLASLGSVHLAGKLRPLV